MRQCDNGHFYDESRFDSCPYCQEGAGVGKTVAASSVGKTVAAVPGGAAPEADRGKTVGIIKKKIGIDPAVGFLVCVSGPHRGADYKLVAGRNFIGRAAAMDVALADDDTVSRESHALVTYDAKHNSFSLSPGQGQGHHLLQRRAGGNGTPLKSLRCDRGGKEPASLPAPVRRAIPVE